MIDVSVIFLFWIKTNINFEKKTIIKNENRIFKSDQKKKKSVQLIPKISVMILRLINSVSEQIIRKHDYPNASEPVVATNTIEVCFNHLVNSPSSSRQGQLAHNLKGKSGSIV